MDKVSTDYNFWKFTMKNKIITKDGLGEIYTKIRDGKCICYFSTADCPLHRHTWTTIYSTSTSTQIGYEK
mgnify:CR=1 FL=1